MMDHRNEDSLLSIAACMENAQRCILQVALKGRVTAGYRERLIQDAKSAMEMAERLRPEVEG